MFVIPAVANPSDFWVAGWGPNNFIISNDTFDPGSLYYLNQFVGAIYAGMSLSVGIPYSVLHANGLIDGDFITVSGSYDILSVRESRTFSVRLNYNYVVDLPASVGGGNFSISGILDTSTGFWFRTAWLGDRAGHLVFRVNSINIYKTPIVCPTNLEI
ncbi:MAG: hypothetical protein WC319_13650 [Candidatus Paceibacterota bacterium]|jgi:hypothetical protein